ncbi:MAG: MCE family protein [Bacteroidetes bacterium]|nr:MCE family protein [Bacteroidota bacterium]
MSNGNKHRGKTGFAALGVLLILAVYYFIGQAGVFSNYHHYYGFYDNVGGLTLGTPVMVKGVQVGKVSNMELASGKGVKVELSIAKDISLPQGSIIWLVPGGINGGQGMRVDPGNSKELLSPGAVLATKRDTGIIDNLTYKSGFYIRSGREILKAFDTSVRKFNYILGSGLLHDIMNGVFYLNKQTGMYEAKSGELKGYAFKIEDGLLKIDTSLVSLNAKNGSLNRSIYKADTTMQKLSKITIKENLDTLRENLKGISASIHKLHGNKMLDDKSAYVNANKKIDSTRTKAKDIKEHPSAHWMSIIGKNRKK